MSLYFIYDALKDGRDKQKGRDQAGQTEGRMPLVLAQASPIFHSSCEGKLGIALE